MKFLIVYSSKTGNTKKVAEALARVAPIGSEIHSIEEAGDADGFDVIFADACMQRMTPGFAGTFVDVPHFAVSGRLKR